VQAGVCVQAAGGRVAPIWCSLGPVTEHAQGLQVLFWLLLAVCAKDLVTLVDLETTSKSPFVHHHVFKFAGSLVVVETILEPEPSKSSKLLGQ
jgi:hypothetical protein